MMRAKIESLEIAYKSVLDLNEKARNLLLKTKKEREDCEAKYKKLRRTEKALEKFLGANDESAMKESDPK